jgi:glycosyltransferase involved in cell wall biosynthesis
MKKILKKIYNYPAKVLLKILFKLRYFDKLALLVKLFPRMTHKIASELMKIGYLEYASNIIKNHTSPQKWELPLLNRIKSMVTIKEHGLVIDKQNKNPIKTISVLFAVHNSLPYDKAGYAVRTHMIARNLKEKGTNIVVTTRAGYPWDLLKHRKGKTKENKNSIDGISYLQILDETRQFKRDSDFKYIDIYTEGLVKHAKENNITVLHGHSNYLNGLATIQAANELKIPSIYEIRGLWHLTRLTLDSNYKNMGMFAYEEEMERGAAQGADAVVTISNALKILIMSWGVNEKKIHVIPNAVDTTLFQPKELNQQLIEKYNLQGRVVLGYVGSLTGYEGLKELIIAVDALIAEKLDITLLIVGEGREKEKLQKLAKSKNIIFTGRVPFEEVQEYYSIFDICPFPRNNYEVCQYVPPLKILEAMAMKKAIIVSSLTPLLEIIEDNKTGLVSEADSVESLKESISKLYHNQNQRLELAQNAYSWVLENRTWDRVSQQYIDLYQSFKENEKSLEKIDLLRSQEGWYFSDKRTVDLRKVHENYIPNKPAYIIYGNSVTKQQKSSQKLLNISRLSKFYLEIDIEKKSNARISCFVQLFDAFNRISSEEYVVKSGKNRIAVSNEKQNYVYLKVLFRVSSNENEFSFSIKELLVVVLENHKNRLGEHIDIDTFLFVKNESTLYQFKPRKDTSVYPLKLPLDWSFNPNSKKDRNWLFQLHAWRMLDNNFFEYEKQQDISKLIATIPIIRDWYRFVIVEQMDTPMNWNDMATGIRAMKLAYLINRFNWDKNRNKISEEDNAILLKLASMHIRELNEQEIPLHNHGIFQVHGLMLLSWILNDQSSINYALSSMNMLLNQQFYKEGVHVENSDDYHWFIYNTFNKILNFEPYQSNKSIQNIMQNAHEFKKWTVFPNKQALLIGDSVDNFKKIDFSSCSKENSFILKYFKESGYLFVRSSFDIPENKASMLFFQTAYRNKAHRHSDDFNILLYEYGINILVDSGKYSYDGSLQRNYIHSTRAHNCVSVDGLNYDIKGQEFYPSALKEATCTDNGIYILKTSLYRQSMQVIHNRNIFYLHGVFCMVIDKLESKKEREYEQFWHFNKDLDILEDNKGDFSTLINDDIIMYIESMSIDLEDKNLTSQKNIQLIRGQTEPEFQGWQSLRYKELVENYAMQNSIKGKKVLLVTRFVFDKKDTAKSDLNVSFTQNKNEVSCYFESLSLNIKQEITL